MLSLEEKRRYESILFDRQTTHKTDYRNIPDTVYSDKRRNTSNLDHRTQFKSKNTRKLHPPLKDIQTLCHRNPEHPYIPFNLFHKRKSIVQTNPHEIQEPFVSDKRDLQDQSEEDSERKQIQETRPRVFMSPAIPLDDVEEPTRDKLIKHMYTTDTKEAMKESASFMVSNNVYIRAPLVDKPAPANVMQLPRLHEPYVSPEWRLDSVTWDTRQSRVHVDSTQRFWQGRNKKPECKVTIENK